MHDGEMGHLELPELINNTSEDLSLKAELILHTQRVCSLYPHPTSFTYVPCPFSLFLSSLLPSLPAFLFSFLEYLPWMVRCMPTQRQILTTKRNIYVFLIDKCAWCILVYLLLEINYTAYFKLYEYYQKFSCLPNSLLKSTQLTK